MVTKSRFHTKQIQGTILKMGSARERFRKINDRFRNRFYNFAYELPHELQNGFRL